jgi:hypothetical protein
MQMFNRKALAIDLVRRAAPGGVNDHLKVAHAIIDGVDPRAVLTMPEVKRWSTTRRWLEFLFAAGLVEVNHV